MQVANQYIYSLHVKDKRQYLNALDMLTVLTQFGALNMFSVHIIAYSVLWFTLAWVIHMFDVVLVYTSTTTSHIMDYK